MPLSGGSRIGLAKLGRYLSAGLLLITVCLCCTATDASAVGPEPAATDFGGRGARLLADGQTREIAERSELFEYCAALDMTLAHCERIVKIVFSRSGAGELVWSNDREVDFGDVAENGVRLSAMAPAIASSPAGLNDYSCMSLHFDPPLPRHTQVAYIFQLRRGGGVTANSRLDEYVAPAAGHVPNILLPVGRLRNLPFSASYSYLAGSPHRIGLIDIADQLLRSEREDTPVTELKWCYFGANSGGSPGPDDIVVIDALQLIFTTDTLRVTDRAELDEYCAVLDMFPYSCSLLSGIEFRASFGEEPIWKIERLAAAPGGGNRSVVSLPIGVGKHSCMSLHFSPPIPSGWDILIDWALGRGGGVGEVQLQAWIPLPADQVPMATRDEPFIQLFGTGTAIASSYSITAIEDELRAVRWCYFGSSFNPGNEDRGRVGRFIFDIDRLEFSDRSMIDGYCEGLDMTTADCSRVTSVSFAKAAVGDLIWDNRHTLFPPASGGLRSVASPPVGAGNYSCMSFHLSPPVLMRNDIRFEYSIGYGEGTGIGGMAFFVAPGVDRVPEPNLMADDRRIGGRNFSPWTPHAVNTRPQRSTEIMWCYFGANPEPGAEDIGRIDLLSFTITKDEFTDRDLLDRYCVALDLPPQHCTRLSAIVQEDAQEYREPLWNPDHRTVAPLAGENNFSLASYSDGRGGPACLALRFDPPWPPFTDLSFWWDLGHSGNGSLPSALQVLLNHGLGDSFELDGSGAVRDAMDTRTHGGPGFAGWTNYRRANFRQPLAELKWCHYEEPGAGIPRAASIARVDRLEFTTKSVVVIADRSRLGEYCTALDMSQEICQRLGSISFSVASGGAGAVWLADHAASSPDGGGISVASRSGGTAGISCMALHFEPPWPLYTDFSFWWDIGHSGEGDEPAAVQVLLNHGDGDVAGLARLRSLGDRSRSRSHGGDGFAGWSRQLWIDFSEPLAELSWCHYEEPGAGIPRPGSIARIDRLELTTESRSIVSERGRIGEYCDALDTLPWICERIGHISFAATGDEANLVWTAASAAGSPEGGNYSVASPPLGEAYYSCMSLHFSPPLVAESSIDFDWTVSGRGRLQRWAPPPAVHLPAVDSAVRFVAAASSGVATWSPHSLSTATEPLAELKWCYFGADSDPGTEDVGRVDRLRIGPYIEALDDREQLAEYCAILDSPAEECPYLSRIVFATTVGNDAVWPSRGGSGVASPAVLPGQEVCIQWEFSDRLTGVGALRIEPSWNLNVEAKGGLVSLYHGEGRQLPPGNFLAAMGPGDYDDYRLWIPYPPNAANYWLRFCYRPGDRNAGAVADVLLTGLVIRRFRATISVSQPTARNRDFNRPPFRRYDLQLAVRLQNFSPAGTALNWGIAADESPMLTLRSRQDMVYTDSNQVLAVELTAAPGSAAVDRTLWLPQSRGVREQYFELLTPNGLLLSSSGSITVPAVAATEEVAALNTFCEAFLATDGSRCEGLVLPGNGLGGGSNFGGIIAQDGRCLILLVGESAEPGHVQTRFAWRGPDDPVVRLVFQAGNAEPPIRLVAPSSGAPVATTVSLPLRPEGQRLSWCNEGTQLTINLGVWGLFRPFAVQHIVTKEFTDSAVLDRYCLALDLPPEHCARLSAVVQENGQSFTEALWDPAHPAVAPPAAGDDVSLASIADGLSGPSCLALRFEPPWPPFTALSFWWDLGHSGDGDMPAGVQVLLNHGLGDTFELDALGYLRSGIRTRLSAERGFAGWSRHRWVAFPEPIAELKWCHYEEPGIGVSRPDSIARIDRLEFSTENSVVIADRDRIGAYCSALDLPESGCDRIGHILFAAAVGSTAVWNAEHAASSPEGGGVSVASRSVGNSGVSCMALQFAPPWPPYTELSFWWDLGHAGDSDVPAAVQVLLNHGPGHAFDFDERGSVSAGAGSRTHDGSGFAGWALHRPAALAEPLGELRWCHYEEPGAGVPRRDSIARLDRLELKPDGRVLVRDRRLIGEYCVALDLSSPDCARIRGMLFDVIGGEENAIWRADHAASSPGGGGLSVASMAAGNVGVSCMALLFDPPWPPYTVTSFWWDLGRSGNGTEPIAVQVLLNHGPGDTFEFDVSGDVRGGDRRSRTYEAPGFAGWVPHRWASFSDPISELKWCQYENFGGIARIDRLEFAVESRRIIGEPEGIAEYCSALDVSAAICEQIRFVLFDPIGVDSSATWTARHAGVSPGGGDFSVASRSVGMAGVSCMGLQFAPPLPRYTDLSFWWDLGRSAEGGVPAAVQVLLNQGPGDAFEFAAAGVVRAGNRTRITGSPGFAGWSRHRWVAFPEPIAELKWCHYEEPGIGVSRPDSIARIDRLQITTKTRTVVAEPAEFSEYCDALDTTQWVCGWFNRIVFVATGGGSDLAWAVDGAVGSPDGDVDSLVSPSVSVGDYSCMSLHFSPPLAVESTIAFDWAVGDGGRLQLWAPPPADQVPAVGAAVPFIADEGRGTAIWSSHSFTVAGEPLGELQWCYFGVSSTSGTSSVGRIDRLWISPNIESLSDRERLAEYCRLLPFADEDCSYLSRIVFSLADADDAVWPVVVSSTAQATVAVVSPAVAAGQEACMRWEFADGVLTGVNALRIDLDWTFSGSAADAGLSVIHGGAAHSPRVLAEADSGSSRRFLWAPHVPTAPNYWLRFCYRPGEQNAGRKGDAMLTRLAIQRLRPDFEARLLTAASRISGDVGYRRYNYSIQGDFQLLAPTAVIRSWGTSEDVILRPLVRSHLDLAYTGADQASLQPLLLSLLVFVGDSGVNGQMWVPQSRRVREQYFELWTRNGLLLSRSSHTVPAIAADDSDALLNRFCAELLAVGDTASCERLVLPGNGTGEWRLSTSSVSVPYIAPPAAVDGSCLRLLVGESAESGGARVGFVWRGPSDSTARLVFHVGDEPSLSRRVAPSSGAPAETAVILPLSPEGQLLNWCIEGTPAALKPDVWGLFRPLSVEHIVSEEISDRDQLERYCLALDLSPQSCVRLSAVVEENRQSFGEAVWDPAHPTVAPSAGGNDVSLASRSDGRAGSSCLALRFDPPWPPYTALSFWWDLGHSGGGDTPAGVQVLLNHGLSDAFEFDASGYPRSGIRTRISAERGFAGWSRYRWVSFPEPIAELKWCHYEEPGSDIARPDSIARVDRLELLPQREVLIADREQIGAYCSALDLPEWGCARIGQILFSAAADSTVVWDAEHAASSPEGGGISVASRSVGSSEVSCMALQFAPPWPPYTDLSFWWDLGHSAEGDAPAAAQVLLNHGPGNAFELDVSGEVRGGIRSRRFEGPGFAGWAPHRWADFAEPLSELKWCYYEGSGSGVPRPDSIVRIDRLEITTKTRVVVTEPGRLGEYCDALDAPQWVCGRLSRIVFAASGGESSPAWTVDRTLGSPDGDADSLVSPLVGAGNYSCLSLHFDSPLSAESVIAFDWAVGEGGRLQLWALPPADQVPAVAITVPFIAAADNSTAIWSSYSLGASDPAIAEFEWCYFGANSALSAARVDRFQVDAYVEILDDREQLAKYCTILGSPAEECPYLSRIVFTSTEGNDPVWPPMAVNTSSFDVLSPAVGAGHETCMQLEFSDRLTAVQALRVEPFLSQGGAADGLLFLYHGEGARSSPKRLLLFGRGPGFYQEQRPWSLYSSDASNYWLRFCYRPGDGNAGAVGNVLLANLVIRRFGVGFSVSQPTAGNHDVNFAQHRRHDLQLAVRLRNFSPAGNALFWDILVRESPKLTVRSRFDMAYSQSLQNGSAEPLALELIISFRANPAQDTLTADTVLWLPQSRRVREQYFELSTPDGLLFSSTSITVPAIGADEDAELNIFCEALVPSKNGSHCENLVLPGDGTGEWQISTSSISVPYIAPPAAVDGSCLRVLVGESAESGWVRVGFVWRGPSDSTARLVFHVGDQAPPSRRVAPSSWTPAEATLMLPLSPEGQLLNWCIEASPAASDPDAWGLFRPLSVEYIVSEEISERSRIERYCLALDLSPQSCLRLSAVVEENGQSFSEAVWDPAHPTVAPSARGNDVSLASRSDGRAGPSCLALQFDPPWPPLTDLSFWWDLGHSGGGDAPAAVQVLVNHGPGDAFEFDASGYPRSGIRTRSSAERGFAGWYWQRWVAFPEPIVELKWCHYEEPGSGVPRPDSIARIDRLQFVVQRQVIIDEAEEIAEYCAALDVSAAVCERIGSISFDLAGTESSTTWTASHAEGSPGGGDFSVASPAVGMAGVSCMALQFAPPWPPYTDLSFWWDLGHSAEGDEPAGVQVLLNHGPGGAFEFDVSGELLISTRSLSFEGPGFAGWVPHRWADLAEPLAELKWCHYEEPGTGVPRPESIARIDRLQLTTKTRVVVTEPERLGEYCAALDAPQWVCGRLSRIVLVATGGKSSPAWTVDRAVGSPDGDVDSLISLPVGAGDYSCMSLYFSPPFAAESAIAFDWAVGGGGRLQLWAPPPVDHVPAVEDAVPFIAAEDSPTAVWSSHSFTVGEALGELRWCYFGANSTASTSSVGRVDRLGVDAYVEILDEREQLAKYCTILGSPATECPYLSRIVFTSTEGNDPIWPPMAVSNSSFDVLSPAVGAGHETCMQWEFSDRLTAVQALRIEPLSVQGGAADGLLFLHHGEGVRSSPGRLLLKQGPGSHDEQRPWSHYSPGASSYWLRFCYRPGDGNAGAAGNVLLTDLVIRRFGVGFSVSQPTAGNHDVNFAQHRRHNLPLAVRLRNFSPAGNALFWDIPVSESPQLTVRSRFDMAYSQSLQNGGAEPLALELIISFRDNPAQDTLTVDTVLWLPQSRRVREQHFELSTPDGLLLSSTSITVPAISADEDAELNIFCEALVPGQNGAHCENLVLPGDGTGEWRISTSSISVPYIAPLAAVDGSCLRVLVGESAESGWVQVGFVWRGPSDSTARLVFHVGDQAPSSRRVAPSSGTPAEVTLILPLSPEGRLLNWCIEASPAASGPDVWGLFRPLSVEHIVSEEISERSRIERYCLALDLSPQSCLRLSAVVQENGQSFSEAVWDPAHPTVAPSARGNDVSLASRSDGRAGPSCLALQFDPPWPPFMDLSFWWDLGHSGAGDAPAAVQVLVNHGPGDAFEFAASGYPRSGIRTRISAERGFAGWSRHRWAAFPEPIAELKWCHYEEPGSGVPRPDSIARIDRLEFVVDRRVIIDELEGIAEYCAALDVSAAVCERIDSISFDLAGTESSTTWTASHAEGSPGGGDFSVASRSVGMAGVSCMALQFAPPWPPYTDLSFWWDLGHSAEGDVPAGVQVLLNHGPGDAFEFDVSGELLISARSLNFEGPGFAGWVPHRWADFAEPLAELKWCHYEEPGTGVPRPESIARIDRLQLTTKTRVVVTEPERLGEYCAALDAPQWVCGRLSRIVLVTTGGESSPAWTVDRTAGSPDGDVDSLISLAVGAGNYSCMSLHFSPPFAAESAIAFDWAVGGGGRLQLWAPPPLDHVPAVADAVPFIAAEDSPAAVWSSHSFTVAEALGELRWCYFAANSTASTSSVGRIDRLGVGPHIEVLEERDRLAEYCRIMPFAVADCPHLSRIVFSVSDADDAVWPVVPVSTAQFGVAVVSPAVAAGQEPCMRWEFADSRLEGVNALRVALSWQLMEGAADAGLSVVHGGAVQSPRLLAEAGGGASDELFWVPHVAVVPNYWLRFCYRPGEQETGGMGAAALSRLGIWRFRPELNIAPPTADNRLSGPPELFGYRLSLAVRLQAVSPTGSDRNWGISDAEAPPLVVRSRFDFVYTGAESALLRPLAVDLLAVGGVAESDTELWLPQSRRSGRGQYFALLTPNGLLLSSSSLTVPEVAADDSDAALNRFCLGLLAVGDTASCERMVLPGNGTGEWRLSTSSTSVPYIAPPAAASGSCLRLLVGEGSEQGLLRLSFGWRGPNSAVARLGFHIGDAEQTSRTFAPSLGEPERVAVMLPLIPQGHRLNWCVAAATESTPAAGVWGLFRPLSVLRIVNDPDLEPVLTVDLLIRSLLFEQERLAATGTRSGMVLPDRLPESLSSRSGLSDIPAEGIESVWSMLYGLSESGRLDVDGNQRYDERDLRLILRYLAGLRGIFLSSDPVDEARLNVLLGP